MEVYLEDNKEIDIDFGDVFFERNNNQYFIFSKLGKNSYGLISSTFDEIYENEIFNSFESAKSSLELYIKEQYLKYYSDNDYDIILTIKNKRR